MDIEQVSNCRLRNELKVILGIKTSTIFQPFSKGVILELIDKEYISSDSNLDTIFLRLLDGEKTSKYIKITFPTSYPFTPPNVFVENNHYKLLLSRLSFSVGPARRFSSFIPNNSKNTRCLCCETKLCKGKWGPSYNINSIVNEIKSNIDIVRSMVVMTLLRKIIDLHLQCYVPIDTFLISSEFTGINHKYWKDFF